MSNALDALPKGCFPLQEFVAPDYGRPASLYVTGGAISGPLPWAIAGPAELEFHTYFNTFFADVWARFATIGRVGLALTIEGTAKVQVATPEGPLAETQASGETVLWLDNAPTTGRLFATLDTQGPATITAMAWVTDIPPLRQPTLSVGICTFMREADVAVTLAALAQRQAANPAIQQIWVVNQGPSFTDEGLAALNSRDGIDILEQPNYGGCGGFTRSMYEAISADRPATYHLLMDDDIKLDPRALDRCLGFLAYAHDDIALGGQMLELEDPTMLYEGGGKLDDTWFVRGIGRETEMTEPGALALFDEIPDIDYNAWWFNVIPTAAIEKVGLPTPIFIRGDDIEYGCRLAKGGVRTIPLPGVVVWHEAFAHKKSDWLTYYDLRNRVYLATLYPDVSERLTALYTLGFVLVSLLQHRYRASEATLLALRDVIGATEDAIGEDSESRHVALMSKLSSMPDYPVLEREDLPPARPREPADLNPAVPAFVWMTIKAIIGLHVSVLFRRVKKPLSFPSVPEPTAIAGQDYIVPTGTDGTRFVHYKVRLGAFWGLFFRALVLSLRYGLKSEARFGDLARDLDEARDQARWRRMFALPRNRF